MNCNLINWILYSECEFIKAQIMWHLYRTKMLTFCCSNTSFNWPALGPVWKETVFKKIIDVQVVTDHCVCQSENIVGERPEPRSFSFLAMDIRLKLEFSDNVRYIEWALLTLHSSEYRKKIKLWKRESLKAQTQNGYWVPHGNTDHSCCFSLINPGRMEGHTYGKPCLEEYI